MKNNPNISKQKVWKAIVAFASLCLIIGLIIYAHSSKQNANAKDLVINTTHEDAKIITQERIKQLLIEKGLGNVWSMPIKSLDLKKIEEAVLKDAWVKKAFVFINNKNNIQIDIVQDKPVARLFFNSGKSVFLNEQGALLPANVNYAYYIPVFTNVPYLGNDEMSKRIKSTIAYVGSHILRDTFWNAQFTQLQLNNNLHILASTVMGDQVIKLGDTSMLKEKLHKLFVFYKDGLSKIGFQQYQLIDASFKGQIVASPGIGYTAPTVNDTSVAMPDEDLINLTRQNAIVNAVSSLDTNKKTVPKTDKIDNTNAAKTKVNTISKQPTKTTEKPKPKAQENNKKTQAKPVNNTATKPKVQATKPNQAKDNKTTKKQ